MWEVNVGHHVRSMSTKTHSFVAKGCGGVAPLLPLVPSTLWRMAWSLVNLTLWWASTQVEHRYSTQSTQKPAASVLSSQVMHSCRGGMSTGLGCSITECLKKKKGDILHHQVWMWLAATSRFGYLPLLTSQVGHVHLSVIQVGGCAIRKGLLLLTPVGIICHL